ncbi:hypothetical protein F5Y10DRAFT_277379 [Nemania abortiva]|nr:hypothetical protein F5Y10DRAFT_277379 [Nemania abortiva]
MGLKLYEIDSATDFPAIARSMFDSYEDPPQTFFQDFFPIHGVTYDAREEAIADYWQKVVDTDTSRIAGGALWNIHKENPFAHEHHMEVVENLAAPRVRVGQRPQVYLFIVFTHPDYRRKGVGQMFMDWGMAKADYMGVELFLDATPVCRPLYDANGFVAVEENVIAPRTDHPDNAWKATEKKTSHLTWFLM